jgi:hypothetical protein
MRSHRFGIVVDQTVDEAAQHAVMRRCPDATITRTPGRPGAVVTFGRDAATLTEAVVSAVRDLDTVGVRAVSVRDDELVTIAAIAARAGRSPETVRLWVAGRTGPGGFPEPVENRLGVAHYRWGQVAPWLRAHTGVALADPAPVLVAVNLALQLRAVAPRIPRMDMIRALIAA